MMNTRLTRGLWLARPLLPVALAVTLACLGCGGGSVKGKTVKVAGTVTLDGAPLAGADVRFIPKGGGAAASGITNANGKFELYTADPTAGLSVEGAMPGEYKVVVTVLPGDGGDPGLTKMDAEEYHARRAKEAMRRGGGMSQGGGGAPKGAKDTGVAVHPNYSDAERTPLTQKVPSDSPIEFKLTKNGT